MGRMDVRYLVIVAISLALSVYVFFAVFDNIPVTPESNATIQSIKEKFATGFQLVAIIGIVLGASWIMRTLNIL